MCKMESSLLPPMREPTAVTATANFCPPHLTNTRNPVSYPLPPFSFSCSIIFSGSQRSPNCPWQPRSTRKYWEQLCTNEWWRDSSNGHSMSQEDSVLPTHMVVCSYTLYWLPSLPGLLYSPFSASQDHLPNKLSFRSSLKSTPKATKLRWSHCEKRPGWVSRSQGQCFLYPVLFYPNV